MTTIKAKIVKKASKDFSKDLTRKRKLTIRKRKKTTQATPVIRQMSNGEQ